MRTVRTLEQEWLRKRLNEADDDQLRHHITYPEFRSQLETLFAITGDNRFIEMRSLPFELGLTEGTDGWKKIGRDSTSPWTGVHHGDEANWLIERGKSKRLAFAIVAVEHEIRAASFEAAMAQVKRAYLELIAEEVKQSPTGKNP